MLFRSGNGGQIDPSKTRYLEEILRDIGLAIAGLFAWKYPHGRFGLDSRNVNTQTEIVEEE